MNDYNKSEIRRLLDLYYEGRTSASEEAVLRRYFSGDDIDSDFEDDRLFFEALAGSGETVEVPADLQGRLSAAIDSWQEAEHKSSATRLRLRLISMRRSFSIAASVALLLAVGVWLFNAGNRAASPVDTYSDPMEAYAETQRVLSIFSNTIDKSMQGLEQAENRQDKALRLALEQLDKI
ncbi:MAG: hypothetical protein K2K72_02315 [Duncaniella sp.]|nr:hypothetical protein [Duncaniella sp.]